MEQAWRFKYERVHDNTKIAQTAAGSQDMLSRQHQRLNSSKATTGCIKQQTVPMGKVALTFEASHCLRAHKGRVK